MCFGVGKSNGTRATQAVTTKCCSHDTTAARLRFGLGIVQKECRKDW